nr:hypothetical protein [Lachnospiraceae bacterium]
CYAIRNSEVIHETVENTGADISRSPVEKLDRFAFAYRNEVYLYKREGIKGIFHIALRTPLHIFRVLTRASGQKLQRIGIILINTLKGFLFDPDIEYLQNERK